MGTIEILHTADLHLAASFKGLPPGIGQLRRRDLVQTLAKLTGLCRDRQTDLLLIAGDLWEQENITRPLVDFVADQFRKIPTTSILISPGRSDGESEDSFYAHYPWPDNVHIFPRGLSSLVLPHLNLRVYGMAWQPEMAYYDWDSVAPSELAGNLGLILAYGSPESLAIPPGLIGLDNMIYIALGGAHHRTVWGEKIWDPGCPEPLGFSCPGANGVLAGTIGKTIELEFLPSGSRQFHQFKIEVAAGSDIEKVGKEIERKIEQYDVERDLFEFILSGIRPQGKWDMWLLRELLKAPYVELRDETKNYPELEDLATEYSHGVIGKYITAIENAGLDSKTQEKALHVGLDALLPGEKVVQW